MTKLFFAQLDKFVTLGSGAGVSNHVRHFLHIVHAALDPLDHGRRHVVVTAHLGFHLADAIVQADDGADAHQIAHNGSGGGNTARFFHLL